MYKYKIHCLVRGSAKRQIVYVDINEKSESVAKQTLSRQHPDLIPWKIYYQGISNNIPIESEKPTRKKRRRKETEKEVE